MYSPKINEEHIPVLYQLGKKLKKPMTVVVNELLKEALTQHQEPVIPKQNKIRKEV